MLSPLCCGRWDGTNLWVQWSPVEGAQYLLRVRLRPAGKEWGVWLAIGGAKPLTKAWRVVQTMREGWQMQAQVAVAGGTEPEWETANEVTFARCSAPFSLALHERAQPMTIEPGSLFSAMVDGAGCSYRLVAPEPLLIQPGTTTEVTMEANQLSAWAQLDAPGDFVSRQFPGLVVTNLAASVNDLLPADPPQDFTTLASAHPGGSHVLVKTGRRFVLPSP